MTPQFYVISAKAEIQDDIQNSSTFLPNITHSWIPARGPG